jgi:hypothetical protein
MPTDAKEARAESSSLLAHQNALDSQNALGSQNSSAVEQAAVGDRKEVVDSASIFHRKYSDSNVGVDVACIEVVVAGEGVAFDSGCSCVVDRAGYTARCDNAADSDNGSRN